MAQKMKVDDEVRLNILKALLDKNSTQANLRRIKAKTKYHLATIKGSLDFLQKEGILNGYGPKIAFWKLSYKLEAVELLQLDFSKTEEQPPEEGISFSFEPQEKRLSQVSCYITYTNEATKKVIQEISTALLSSLERLKELALVTVHPSKIKWCALLIKSVTNSFLSLRDSIPTKSTLMESLPPSHLTFSTQ